MSIYRTHTCNEISLEDVGKKVKIAGFVQTIRDFGGLVLNRTSHECVYNEVPLTLTPIEFDILWLLCENRGKVISSEELFEKVWHEKYYKNSNNTVMVHIRHLREKMSAPTGKSDFIKTVWGVGYKVEE